MSVFETQRQISALPGEVFGAFEDGTVLCRWWGPTGFSNTFESFEFREGGAWRFVMHGPDGRNYPNENSFVEISRPDRIIIRHLSEPRFTLTVSITESGPGALIHWRQEFDSEDVARAVAHIVRPANEQNLDRLEAVLAGR